MTGGRRPEPSGAELWTYVRAAARGERHGPAGTVAALATLAGVPRLGWVEAPPWSRISRLLAARTETEPLRNCRRALFVGTGGWAFGLRALCEAVPGQSRVRVLDSLDPVVLRRVLGEVGEAAGTACVAVSSSGRTRETRLLADTLAALWQRTGGAPPLRLSEHDGGLSLTGGRDQVALYGVPLSVPALLAARMLTRPRFAEVYREFAEALPAIGEWAGEQSRRLPATGTPRVVFRLPAGAGAGLRLWTLQAARQGWGGKSERFRPWPEAVVAGRTGRTAEPDSGRPAAPGDIVLDLGEASAVLPRNEGGAGPVAGAMVTSYAVAALVACVAVRHGLRFASHDAVEHYKRLVPALPTAAHRPVGGRPVSSADELTGVLAGWLANRPDLTTLHVVGYGVGLATVLGADRGLTERLGRPVEVHEGSSWNHHSYQLVWHTRSVGVAVVLAPDRPVAADGRVFGPALTTLRRTLDALAGATYLSLAPRCLLLRWCPGASGTPPPVAVDRSSAGAAECGPPAPGGPAIDGGSDRR
ncbi:hypothetical protein [Plantactinospora sonchi]|uniref:Glucose-6-phosphate isomerase n=1 Tax=Plantactinospora sonchi TaxID=1544735 RepID=A0ABU7RUP2_9ACTN